MKILAINSSPRGGGQSMTKLMLNHLVDGMRNAKADVEIVDLRKQNIKNCIGCFTCWTKTPGKCIHKDDMENELFPKWLESDLVVYATPLYHYTVNASLKAFIERTLPVLEPFFLRKNEKTYHPWRHKHPKVVILSVAGFPEMSVFDQLSAWVNFIFGNSKVLVAEIYRPLAPALTLPFVKGTAEGILKATSDAGQEIVENMEVSTETMMRITQSIVEDQNTFLEIGNLMWKTCIEDGITPKEFEERGLIPRPDSLESFMTVMPLGFNPDAAGDREAIIQFDFSGKIDGSCYLKIDKGIVHAALGPAQKPDLTIDTPFEVWIDIMSKRTDGQKMFMEQKYKANGDLSLLIRMNQLFGS